MINSTCYVVALERNSVAGKAKRPWKNKFDQPCGLFDDLDGPIRNRAAYREVVWADCGELCNTPFFISSQDPTSKALASLWSRRAPDHSQ